MAVRNGTVGDDRLLGTSGDDTLSGLEGDDTLLGLAGNDFLYGSAGRDVLTGGPGDDLLDGGIGRDTASYTSADQDVQVDLRLTEAQETYGAGIDQLVSIENVIGSRFNDYLIGDARANTLIGGDGRDSLGGLDGNDILRGGVGDDTLFGGSGDDRLLGGKGQRDWASYAGAPAAISLDLAAGTAQDGYGGVDRLAGIEFVTGSQYDDVMIGSERADELSGNPGDDSIWGGDGADYLRGSLGNDRLSGDAGNDRLQGDDGDDWLYGGAGRDSLFGDDGADIFVFVSLADSGLGGRADEIGFRSYEGDLIDLSAIDAIAGGADDAFTYIGTSAFHGVAGELRINVTNGGRHSVQMDVDGDGANDMSIRLFFATVPLESDFIL